MSKNMPPVWRIEAKVTPFSPWMNICAWWRIETMPAEVERIKRVFHFYAVRGRVN